MNPTSALLVFLISSILFGDQLPNRWYRHLYSVNNSFFTKSSAGLDSAKRVAIRAKNAGYTGTQLPLDYFFMKWSEANKKGFADYLAFCDSLGLEVIPEILPINTGGVIWNRNFAEAEPVDSIKLVRTGSRLLPAEDIQDRIANGTFSDSSGDGFTGFLFHDKGVVRENGEAKFTVLQGGMQRICQELVVPRKGQYRLTFTLNRNDYSGTVRVLVATKQWGNEIQRKNFVAAANSSQKITVDFTNGESYDSLRIYIGAWNGSAGSFSIDNLTLTQSPVITDIIRREACTVSMKNRSAKILSEKIDFDSIPNSDTITGIPVPAGSSIAANDTVFLSCYRVSEYNGEKAVCLSNELFQTFADSLIRGLFAYKKFDKVFLYFDEIRSLGTCGDCKARGSDYPAILGTAVARVASSLEKQNPEIQVFTWADMFDPNWNGHDHYFKVGGNIAGAIDHLPKKINIVPWGDCETGSSTSPEYLSKSADYFIANGHKIMGCGYYDTKKVSGTENWRTVLLQRPSSLGWIYASWNYPPDYSQLEPCGTIISETNTAIHTSDMSQKSPVTVSVVNQTIHLSRPVTNGSIQIYSMTGKKLVAISVNGSTTAIPVLIAPGTYCFVVSDREILVSRKVCVK